MTEIPQTYRVSTRYLTNVWQQAFYGSVGAILSWALFWMWSQHLLPSPGVDGLADWVLSPKATIARLSSHWERELVRTAAGPGIAIAALLGGLADFLTWVFVRYEIHADKLVMRWNGWTRRIAWDVVKTVKFRPHSTTSLQSMVVSAIGLPSILVRGLERMPEFCEAVRTRVPHETEWPPTPYRVDLTTRWANFAIGLLVPIPIHATWLVGYVGEFSVGTISLIWAWLAAASAVTMWYWRPLSRRQVCAVELELAIAALMVLLCGLLTVLSWLETGTPPPWVLWVRFLF